MTIIAQLDLALDPHVVLFMWNYANDPVPPHMIPPEYVDVTHMNPLPQPGYTYDGRFWKPGEPQQRAAIQSNVADATEQALAVNNDYLALDDPTRDEMVAQIANLTKQQAHLQQMQLEQYGRAQDWTEFEPPPPPPPEVGHLPTEPLPEPPPVEEPPPDEQPPPTEEPPPHVDEEPVVLFATFTFTPAKPAAKAAVQFDATASTGPISSYAWDFGDGSLSRSTRAPTTGSGGSFSGNPTPSHAYDKKGTYTVVLHITGEGSSATEAQQSITVT